MGYKPAPAGIQRFSGDTPAFVLHSFADIRDVQTAREAITADAYCIQLVSDKLLTKKLCRTALQSPKADEKMLKFAVERFLELKTERIPFEEFVVPLQKYFELCRSQLSYGISVRFRTWK